MHFIGTPLLQICYIHLFQLDESIYAGSSNTEADIQEKPVLRDARLIVAVFQPARMAAFFLSQDLRQPGYGHMAEMDAPAKGPAIGGSGPAKLGVPKDAALETGGTNTFEVRSGSQLSSKMCLTEA